jgi:hypothetical protein
LSFSVLSTYIVGTSSQNKPETKYSIRHYDKLYIPILLIANLVPETFHVLEAKIDYAEGRRGFQKDIIINLSFQYF